MTVTVTTSIDGKRIEREVTVGKNTRFTGREDARRLDCVCCDHFLGRFCSDCVCNAEVCEAEECGYDARNLRYKDDKVFMEVFAV